ncbi:BREX system ATP-binding domain-containing protein [Mesorhizobium caraganae]|uniref:BREX system ATP-binding domain-containing protein n=1 Tax=Mesorhizobium caraganae TaxID=483206 RepID=UPI003339714E
MSTEFSAPEAIVILEKLSNAPTAPGGYAHFINVGTDPLLDILEQRYFRDQLNRGLGTFKYLQAGYGGGKTQFILSLAERAQRNQVVTCRVDVGTDCPFNSKLAIFKSVLGSFLPLGDALVIDDDDRGIVVLIEKWIERRLKEYGVDRGDEVPDAVRAELSRTFTPLMNGAADHQMGAALRKLGQRLLEHACGATPTTEDDNLISWVRGDKVTSTNLKSLGLSEPAKDENAFNRLNTALKFLRTRLGYRGFLIAFDEGSRAMSFRRGSIKQKQLVENLLDFINKTGDQQFGGVMFLYAANDEFRADLISKYEALENRIGSVSMSAGSPMVPFIDLDAANTPEVLQQLGERLMDIFDTAKGISLDRDVQRQNFDTLKAAYTLDLRLSPRTFVALIVRFLPRQAADQRLIGVAEAEAFVNDNDPDRDITLDGTV